MASGVRLEASSITSLPVTLARGDEVATWPMECPPEADVGPRATLAFIEKAAAQIAGGKGGEAALRELWAFLIDLMVVAERDPGLELAAEDVYGSAAVLVSEMCTGPRRVDVRRLRLLKEAVQRLRSRLDPPGPVLAS